MQKDIRASAPRTLGHTHQGPPLHSNARDFKPTAKHLANETALVKRIDSIKKKRSASGVNQYTKQSIYRVVFDSELDITSLRQVASIFEIPERKVLAALRERHREVLNSLPPPPVRGGIVVPLRRVA